MSYRSLDRHNRGRARPWGSAALHTNSARGCRQRQSLGRPKLESSADQESSGRVARFIPSKRYRRPSCLEGETPWANEEEVKVLLSVVAQAVGHRMQEAA